MLQRRAGTFLRDGPFTHGHLEALAAVTHRFGWIVGLLLLAYLFSGVTVIGPQEVALVLRFGRLSGDNAAAQIHLPGILWALPYPVDSVVRVPIRREMEVAVKGLGQRTPASSGLGYKALDPVGIGYVLTGDQSILHLAFVVKYRVNDAVAYALSVQQPEALIEDITSCAVTRIMGQLTLDDALRLRRDQTPIDLMGSAQNVGLLAMGLAQERLDLVHAGMQISAIEFKEVQPPDAVINEFKAAQSARVEKETVRQEALAFKAAELPRVESVNETMVLEAMALGTAVKSQAVAESAVFSALAAENRKDPEIQKVRMWREALQDILHHAGDNHFFSSRISQGGVRLLLSKQGVE